MNNKEEIRKMLEEVENLNPTEEQIDKIKEMKEEYSGKSENEIFFEIIKLNEKMEETMQPEEYENLIEKLERIRPLLDEEQTEKLDKVLQLLGRE